jgi:hypothetical protein
MAAVAMIAAPLGAWRELSRRPVAVVLGGTVHDFGSMPGYAVGRHRWVIGNAGRAPLRLELEGTSCVCAFADLHRDQPVTIAPGGRAAITLCWDTPAACPRYRQTGSVTTNDPQHPIIQLWVEGDVVPAEAAGPPAPPPRWGVMPGA